MTTDETIQVPLAALRDADDTNPRQGLGDIEGLAKSIQEDGLINNLLVTANGRRGTYEVVGGKRRFAALKLLEGRGDLPADYEVTVKVRRGTSKADRRRLGIVENVQREDLHPMEEAEAWFELLAAGGEVEDLAARTGLTIRTIKRRLALRNLCDEVRAIFREGQCNLAEAQAFSLGTHQQQRDLLDEIERSPWRRHIDEDYIEKFMTRRRPTVATAIFPMELYTGSLTTNLFRDEDETYFDDVDQFMELQRAEVERRAEEYRNQDSVEWVDVIEASYVGWYQYGNARKNAKKYGVALHFHTGTGAVEIRELLKRSNLSTGTSSALSGADRPKPPKPTYGPKLALEIGRHKTLAVQSHLLANPRRAKEIAAFRLLIGWGDDRRVHIGKANQHAHLADMALGETVVDDITETFNTIDKMAQVVILALYPEDDVERGILALDELAWRSNAYGYERDVEVYERIKKLDDDTLDKLLLLLPVLTFGEQTYTAEVIDTKPSLFNAVAQDLGVDMKQHWRPGTVFLNARTKDQLTTIAEESGALAALGKLPAKKGAMVEALADYFATSDSEAARAWLPGAMEFPARDEALALAEAEPVEEEQA